MELLAPLLGKTLVLVAHPDDEAVGCGALLQRMHEPLVVFATDGAPRDSYFWNKYGSREAYAEVRYREAHQALALVGVEHIEFLPPKPNPELLFLDQDLFLAVPRALKRLKELVEEHQPEALLVPAYEGGHPDHDTCCFLGQVLSGQHHLPAYEMPLYHRSADGVMVMQEFMMPNGTEVLLDVTPEEAERKRAMFATYASQGLTLANFSPGIERYRPLAHYDFTQPPHPGVLNYEAWKWPITGEQVAAAFQACIECRHRPKKMGPYDPGVREVS